MRNNLFASLVVIAAICFVSCVKLDLKYTQQEFVVDRPVEYTFDYGQGITLPESVTVAQINTLRPDKNLTFECSPSGTTVSIANGEWRALAIASKQNNVIYHGLESFIKKEIASIKNITAEIDTLTTEEVSAIMGAHDVNTGFPYFKPINGLFTSYSDIDVSPTASNKAYFKMVDLSTTMKFIIHYELDKGIELVSTIAELSGVPSTANVMDREILTAKTGKLLFDMEDVSSGRLEGLTSGMGVLSPDDAKTLYGKGIFTIRFRVRMNDEFYIIIGSINLKNMIEAADFYQVSDRPGVYTKKTDGVVVFDIPNVLRITKSGLEDNGGVKHWVHQAFIDEVI